ncbi:MAG: hypothetical protein BWK78_07325 [Thiotrichaceae bacterium IS1]|nr:MAG: hypothetical protein BWK78_07325 [Thiotrichaceae bacterium IS1]
MVGNCCHVAYPTQTDQSFQPVKFLNNCYQWCQGTSVSLPIITTLLLCKMVGNDDKPVAPTT